jgi:hypothetical protein
LLPLFGLWSLFKFFLLYSYAPLYVTPDIPRLTLFQAGAFAAFTVDLLVYPLDTLKTRFQSPDYKRIYYDASTNVINRKLLFRGLYQGIGSVVLITIPSCT